MPKIADALERESRTVDLEHGDFERLLDRRERKQRNRRIRAGAVGVIVALAIGHRPRPLADLGPDSGDPPVEPRGRRRRRRGPSPTSSTATSTSPIRTGRTRSRSGRPRAGRLRLHRRVPVLGRGIHVVADGRYLAYRRVDCSSEEDRHSAES